MMKTNQGKLLRLLALFIATLCMASLCFADDYLTGDKYSEKQIRGIIGIVEQDLDGVKNSKAGEIADKEVQEIEKGIIKTKKLLKQGKLEEAFYEIEITRSYFSTIEARLELYYSRQILDQSSNGKAKN